MTNAERMAKIEHYEFMLATMTLDPRHKWWIKNQLNDLRQEVSA